MTETVIILFPGNSSFRKVPIDKGTIGMEGLELFVCVGADYHIPYVCSLKPMTRDGYAKCPIFDTFDTEVRDLGKLTLHILS